MLRSLACICVIFASAGWCVRAAVVARATSPADPRAGPSTRSASGPASRPAGRTVPLYPGVVINWAERQVELEASVVMRQGPLELFACSPRTREYESILRVRARPWHIYLAMGLIGLRPGHPPYWDAGQKRMVPATGDRVDLFVRYPCPEGADSGTAAERTVPIRAWMRMRNTKAPMPRRSWVFAGSVRFEDGAFAADVEGTVVTVVDFASALIALSESHTADNASLWLEPDPQRIPPVGTRCTLLIRPAVDSCAATTTQVGRHQPDGSGRCR